MRRLRCSAMLLLAGVATACELEKVTVGGGEPVVVVSVVLRPDRRVQFVIVERSFNILLRAGAGAGRHHAQLAVPVPVLLEQ